MRNKEIPIEARTDMPLCNLDTVAVSRFEYLMKFLFAFSISSLLPAHEHSS